MPKISFVMPAKNRDDLIAESIQSVIDQTFTDWELIIVDNHSDEDDKTSEIVQVFGDKRIRYFELNDDDCTGISCARNFGNKQARSPIIAVADSDDLSLPERASLIWDSYQREKWDVFYGKYLKLIDETGEVTEPDNQPTPYSFLDYLNRGFFVPHSSSAYRKEIADLFPYDPSLKMVEDFDFFLRVGASGKKFYFCPKFIYKYRVHNKSITKGKGFHDIEEAIIKKHGLDKYQQAKQRIQ